MRPFFRYLLFLYCLIPLLADGQPDRSFVTTKGHQLQLNNHPWYFIGANYWYGALVPANIKGRERIRKELDFLQHNGITTLRVLAAAEGTGIIHGNPRVGPALQPRKGVFDQSILTGLDFLLAEMGKRRMKAVLYLSNNWEWSGGFLQYLNWNGQFGDTDLKKNYSWDENRDFGSRFYSCDSCIAQYNAQLKLLLNRTNSITRQPYRDDPAILAWELANEPRPMRAAAIPAFKQWIRETAAMIKQLDPHHLVTIGSEGDLGSERMDVYKEIQADKNIDYATIHIWPKNWGWFHDTAITAGFDTIVSHTNNYIDRHLAILQQLDKPLVLEEFGLPRDDMSYRPGSPTHSRDLYYALYFKKIVQSKEENGWLAGASFWAFSGAGRPSGKRVFWSKGDEWLGDPPMEEQGLNSVFDCDTSTWETIRFFTAQIN